ncbi:hypothetical protein HMPREF0281_00239 [Corynebacterium ammoniagenes DSM 20306]|uniref:Uncharacterized protein n=1 Tax=Corynebacterium ammoniagenes DSM 20306 TaxID=649754 RepID=A0ABP2IMX3_CORAM|nr:hypothetical protein HMPREF0281_00239 [Corynebacterium ammoniagenes DSM 20306]
MDKVFPALIGANRGDCPTILGQSSPKVCQAAENSRARLSTCG